MRKQNSSFNTAFVSHEGTQLNNNDYFGYVTLDKFACYVVADGLETWDEVASAQVAVEAIIAAFTARPSIKKSAVKSYIRTAHANMRDNRTNLSMKASITVVVTDYVALRYGYVGNTRFNLFRSGYLMHESIDHSLSTTMASRREIPLDKVAQHEERGNLYRYLGQEGNINPQISKKIKLQDGDIVALFTRGVWENCDSYDLLAAFTDAGNFPMIACDLVERLILDPHPEVVDNYTMAVIFIDKVFTDPDKGKKLKLILKIAIPVAAVLLALLIVLLVLNAQRKKKYDQLEVLYNSSVTYIEDDNYIRAREEIEKADELARSLNDQPYMEKIDRYKKLVEAVVAADDLFAAYKFDEAREAYKKALNRSAYTDNMALGYIDNKLKVLSDYVSVHDMIERGNTYSDRGQYDLAEKQYLAAQTLANKLNYQEGKDQATEAWDSMKEIKQADADRQKNDEKTGNLQTSAEELVVEGVQAEAEKDYDGAKDFYQRAKEKYEEAGNDAKVKAVEAEIARIEKLIRERDKALGQAEKHMSDGKDMWVQGDNEGAKREFQKAKVIYDEWEDTKGSDNAQGWIESMDRYIQNAQSKYEPDNSGR